MSIQYGGGPGNAFTSGNRRLVADCGGCIGLGAHWRWCPEVVGPQAWRLGLAAETVESLADQLGSIDPAAANICYAAAARLRLRAGIETAAWKRTQS